MFFSKITRHHRRTDGRTDTARRYRPRLHSIARQKLLIAHFVLHHPISEISFLLHFVSVVVISLLNIRLISLVLVYVHHHHFYRPLTHSLLRLTS